jgi:hypothetical protein
MTTAKVMMNSRMTMFPEPIPTESKSYRSVMRGIALTS